MNEAFSVLLDTAKLATGGSDIARREGRRLAAERERRAAERALDLHPAAVIATGTGTEPAERLIGLQSAVGKFVGWLAGAGHLRFRLPAVGVLRFRFW
jgi:hypothetical protein